MYIDLTSLFWIFCLVMCLFYICIKATEEDTKKKTEINIALRRKYERQDGIWRDD